MRSPAILLSAAVLAACAAPSGVASPEAWRRVQAERLQRLHADQDFAAAMARVRAAAPQGPQGREAVPARARKIDQIEPPLHAANRRVQGTNFPVRVAVQAGTGAVGVNVADTLLDDHAGMASLRIAADFDSLGRSGTSLVVRAASSADDLFAGARINDGTAPARADARVRLLHAFPGVRFGELDGGTGVPVRAGVGLGWLEIDHHQAAVQRSWTTVGLRLEADPSWCMIGDAGGGLDLTGHLGGELGHGWFDERFDGNHDGAHAAAWQGEAGIGLRWRFAAGAFELGGEWGHRHFGETSTELLGQKGGASVVEQRLFVGGSLRF